MIYSYIDPLATGLGDGSSMLNAYTSPALWQAGEATDLVSAAEGHHVYAQNLTETVEFLLDSTLWTVDATYFVTFEVLDGFDGIPSKSNSYFSYGSGIPFKVTLDYSVIIGVQAFTDNDVYAAFQTSCAYPVLRNCYGYGKTGIECASGIGGKLQNCVGQGKSAGGLLASSAGNSWIYDNCVFTTESYTRAARLAQYNSSECINCYAAGGSSLSFDNSSGTNTTMTNCASDDGSLSTTVVAYTTATFTSVTAEAEDFHLVTGSALDEAGIGPDLNSDVYIYDIDGTERTGDTADIGIAELTGVVTYNVTYDDNSSTSGTVPTDSTDYSSGDTVTVLGNTGTLVRTDYTWAGWNTQADGLGTHYDTSDTFSITSNTTLYAEWEAVAVTYTLTYDGNDSEGGTVPVDGSSPYDSGEVATILGNSGSLTLSGEIFVCWNTLADGTGTNYEESDTLTITEDTVLYALWKTEAELIESYLNPSTTGGLTTEQATWLEAINDRVLLALPEATAGDALGLVRGTDTDSLEDVADAVVDELLAGHTTVDSLGYAVTVIQTVSNRLNALIEDSTGDRFTAKALEEAPSGTGGDATLANQNQILSELAVVDNNVDTILVDTNELQTNQGDWVTATGFNTVTPDNTSITAILEDTGTTIPAQITALNDFDPANDVVANVTLVDTVTTNTDMVTTENIATAVWNFIVENGKTAVSHLNKMKSVLSGNSQTNGTEFLDDEGVNVITTVAADENKNRTWS